MASVYKITNNKNGRAYIGITRNQLNRRWNHHVYQSKRQNTPLYAAMRKYGLESFSISEIVCCSSWEDACHIEALLIKESTDLYNLAPGGQGGFNIQDVESWKKKLSAARKGRKPFLGK